MDPEKLIAGLALIGIVIIVSALLSGLVDRSGLPQVAVFILIGAALGPFGLGVFDMTLESPILRVAAALLAGDIDYRAKKYDDAIGHYEDAVKKADALKYDEPPAWYQPPRLFLGKALLDAGRAADAEKVYREDLVHHPNLGWTLMGLTQALEAQGKTREAGIARAEFEKAWAGADVKLTSSRF